MEDIRRSRAFRKASYSSFSRCSLRKYDYRDNVSETEDLSPSHLEGLSRTEEAKRLHGIW